jgi:hypothetical protein
MTAAELFRIANGLALLGWLLLVLAPRWRGSVPVARSLVCVFCLVYVVVLGLHWGEGEGGFDTLENVAKLFANPWVLTGGWIHYLAFDLFCGSWIVAEGRRRGLALWRVIPCLPLTFMFGPAGLGLFYLLNGDRDAFGVAAQK